MDCLEVYMALLVDSLRNLVNRNMLAYFLLIDILNKDRKGLVHIHCLLVLKLQ